MGAKVDRLEKIVMKFVQELVALRLIFCYTLVGQ